MRAQSVNSIQFSPGKDAHVVPQCVSSRDTCCRGLLRRDFSVEFSVRPEPRAASASSASLKWAPTNGIPYGNRSTLYTEFAFGHVKHRRDLGRSRLPASTGQQNRWPLPGSFVDARPEHKWLLFAAIDGRGCAARHRAEHRAPSPPFRRYAGTREEWSSKACASRQPIDLPCQR